MPRPTAADFDPEVLKLFDQYVHGGISRRDFLSSATRYAVGGSTAAGLLASLSPSFAAPLVKPDDSRLKARYAELPSPDGNGKVRGYLVSPARAEARLPLVLVVHENRGLNAHIEDIARRLALDGFIAFAPDALYTLGGYPGDEDQARTLFSKLDQNKTRADFVAAARWLQQLPAGNGKLGVVGFCYGGGIANYLATQLPDLKAAVPFYGAQPRSGIENIKAALLIHDAGNDERIRAGWPAYEQALKAAGVAYEYHVYPGVEHGFNNDTTPRYDAAAAKLAWQRTTELFKARLA
ncbi:dienelactone hydrolase family protein [Oxalobacteraceae bacterium A2-2]